MDIGLLAGSIAVVIIVHSEPMSVICIDFAASLVKTFIPTEMKKLSMLPIKPPISPINPASMRNTVRILPRKHPSAFITPISRVRSDIDIIIVFVMPRAATNRETAPSPPSIICCFRASSSRGLRTDSIE